MFLISYIFLDPRSRDTVKGWELDKLYLAIFPDNNGPNIKLFFFNKYKNQGTENSPRIKAEMRSEPRSSDSTVRALNSAYITKFAF